MGISDRWVLACGVPPCSYTVVALAIQCGCGRQADQLELINRVIDGLSSSPALQVAPAVASAVSAPVSTPGTASEPPFVRRTMLAHRVYALVVAARRHGVEAGRRRCAFRRARNQPPFQVLSPRPVRDAIGQPGSRTQFSYQHAVSDLTQDDMHRVKLETSGI